MKSSARIVLLLAVLIAAIPLWHHHLDARSENDPNHQLHCVLSLLTKCSSATVVAQDIPIAVATEPNITLSIVTPVANHRPLQTSPRAPPIA